MTQMEAHVVSLQVKITALEQQTEQNRLEIQRNGRQPLITPKTQPGMESYPIYTPQKSAGQDYIGAPSQGVRYPPGFSAAVAAAGPSYDAP